MSNQVFRRKTSNSILEIVLNDKERSQVDSMLQEIFKNGQPDEISFINGSHLWGQELPRRIRNLFYDFKMTESHLGILVSNSPIENTSVPQTPAYYRELQPDFKLIKVEALHAIYGSLLGEAFAFKAQREGHPINTIVPLKEFSQFANNNSGSDYDFMFHTEDAFHPYLSNYLGLACARNTENAPTTISSIQGDIIEELDIETKEILFGDYFYIKGNAGHKEIKPEYLEPKSILFGDFNDPYLRINVFDFTDSKLEENYDEKTRTVIKKVISILNRNKKEIILKPGQFLYVDNLKTVHGRNKFQPNWENPRWLIRTIFSCDLKKSRSVRSHVDSRVIA